MTLEIWLPQRRLLSWEKNAQEFLPFSSRNFFYGRMIDWNRALGHLQTEKDFVHVNCPQRRALFDGGQIWNPLQPHILVGASRGEGA